MDADGYFQVIRDRKFPYAVTLHLASASVLVNKNICGKKHDSAFQHTDYAYVVITMSIELDIFYRPVGCDIGKGEKVLSAGDRLGPAELGILAAVGITTVNTATTSQHTHTHIHHTTHTHLHTQLSCSHR